MNPDAPVTATTLMVADGMWALARYWLVVPTGASASRRRPGAAGLDWERTSRDSCSLMSARRRGRAGTRASARTELAQCLRIIRLTLLPRLAENFALVLVGIAKNKFQRVVAKSVEVLAQVLVPDEN